MGEIQRRLAEKGLRVTPQRVAIYDFLAHNRNHPTAADIYEAVRHQYPMISPATVYKTLEVLVQLGEVVELAFPDGVNRYDSNAAPHIHLVCVRCEGIMDVEDATLQALEADAVRRTGFAVSGRRYELYGLCQSCMAATERQAQGTPLASGAV